MMNPRERELLIALHVEARVSLALAEALLGMCLKNGALPADFIAAIVSVARGALGEPMPLLHEKPALIDGFMARLDAVEERIGLRPSQ